ncbi:cation:proton antiporter [Spirillospora sp. CA-255316]
MDPAGGLTSHVFIALIAIVLVAAACGRLANAAGQPRVVGEMVAGVLMGPSLLGELAPAASRFLFPREVVSVLYVLSTIGLVFFMFLVGASLHGEVLDRRAVREAMVVGGTGVGVPFVLGAGTALLVAGQVAEPGASTLHLALLLGGALTVTAFPTLARILEDRRMQFSRLGAITLLAGSVDDIAAWILLVLVIALAFGGSAAQVAVALVGTALFTAAMLTLGRRLMARVARVVERERELTPGALATTMLFVAASAWATHELGVHFVFGGFLAGLALPRSPMLRERLRGGLMDMNAGLLMPVFFVHTGLNTDIDAVLRGSVVGAVIAIVAVAFAGKYLSCLLAMRLQGNGWRISSAVGALMNARGLMILIFIGVGRQQGLLGQDLYSILVLVAVLTTCAAVPLYRLSLPGPREDAERNRAAAAVPVPAGRAEDGGGREPGPAYDGAAAGR